VPVISTMGGSRDSPTARMNTWTIVPVDIPGSKWWKQRDKPPACAIVLALTRREAERIAREHEEARSIACVEPGKATADELDRAAARSFACVNRASASIA